MASRLRKKTVTSKHKTARKSRPPRIEIARRAYEIFVGRGAADGHDIEDWLQAETELLARQN
jgi:Protein of unknown function (DUF2934)